MKYLLLSLLVFSTAAVSAEQKIIAQAATKKTAAPDKTLDAAPESASKEMADQTGLFTNNHSMKAKVSCKTKDGHEIKPNEKGYDECLKNSSDVKVEFEK